MIEKGNTKNTDGLKAYAEQRNQDTIARVNKAIDHLKRARDSPINFKTVAEAAGVSKATLYNNEIIRERIASLRALDKNVCPITDENQPDEKKQLFPEKIKQLHQEIGRLRKEKKALIIQLVMLEELKEENRKLREQVQRHSFQKNNVLDI